MRYWLALLLLSAPLFSAHPLFNLDAKWQIVDPRELKGDHLDYMFLNAGRSIAGLRLVLAHENFDGSLDEYLQECVKLNNASPNTWARRLGSYTTSRGLKGELLEVEADGPIGKMVTIQLITLRDGLAYVLTITTDKKSFLKENKVIMQIFDSFWFSEDPLADCLEPKISQTLKKYISSFNASVIKIAKASGHDPKELFAKWRETSTFRDKLWPDYARLIEKHFTSLGPIWQLEALKWSARHIETFPSNFQKFPFPEKSNHATLKKRGEGNTSE